MLRVLLIEDSPTDVLLIREMLAQASASSFDLQCVNRLSAGLEYLATTQVDVVLLDLSLPDSHGLETVDDARARAPEMPLVVLTGQGDETIALEAVRKGAQDYLVKGQFDGRLLVRAVRYAIERHELQAQLRRQAESLSRSEAKHRALLRAVPDMLLRARRDGALLDVRPVQGDELSPAAVSAADNVGGVLPPDVFEKFLHHVERALETRAIQTFQYQTRVGDVVRHQEVRIAVSGDEEVLAIVRDITSQKELERQQLLRSQAEAVMALGVTLNHEINNVLQPIVTSADMLLQEIPESAREWRESVERILDAGKRIAAVVRKLRGIVRPVSKEYLGDTRMLDLDASTDATASTGD